MLGGVEDVAALANIEQEIQREAFVPERIADTQREIGLAIVAGVDEVRRHRARADRQTRRRIDQQLPLIVPQVVEPGKRHGGQADLRPVAHVAVQPGVGDVGFRDAVGQLGHDAARGGKVQGHVPAERRPRNRRAAGGQLQTAAARRGAVQVEQNEASAVAAAEVFDDLVLRRRAIHRGVQSQAAVQERELHAAFDGPLELGFQREIRTPEVVPVSAVGRRLVLQRRPVRIRPRVLADRCKPEPHLSGHEATETGKRVGEDEAGRYGRIEKRIPPARDRGRPVIAAGEGDVPVVLVIEDRLAEQTHQPALLDRGQRRARARVVHRHEVRIQEIDAGLGIRCRFEVTHLVADEAAEREAVGERVVIDVEEREGTQVAGDDVRQIEYPSLRIAGDTLRMSQQQILRGVVVRAQVRLDVAPGEWGHDNPDVGDQAVGFRVDLVLGNVEVGVVELSPGPDRRHEAPRSSRRQIVPRIVGLRPQHQAHERADVALVDLVVVRVAIDHRQVGVQPRVDSGLRGPRDVDFIEVRVVYDAFLLVERGTQPVVDRIVGRRPTERQVVILAQPFSQETIDVVVELRSCRIRGAEVLQRCLGAVDEARGSVHALQLVVGARGFDPHRAAVLHAAARPAALRLDHDRAVGGIDAVQRGGLRALQHGERLDVL